MSDDDKFFRRDSALVRLFNYPITVFRGKYIYLFLLFYVIVIFVFLLSDFVRK
jgi:hypothetical protein